MRQKGYPPPVFTGWFGNIKNAPDKGAFFYSRYARWCMLGGCCPRYSGIPVYLHMKDGLACRSLGRTRVMKSIDRTFPDPVHDHFGMGGHVSILFPVDAVHNRIFEIRRIFDVREPDF